MTKEQIDALRFNVPNGKTVTKDAFITGMMELFFVESQIGVFTGKGRVAKLLIPAEKLLKLELAGEDAETRALFVEAYKDTALTFIKISRKDRSYSTGLLKLVAISDAEFENKIRSDLRILGTELPEKGGKAELFSPFTEGLALAIDEYFKTNKAED